MAKTELELRREIDAARTTYHEAAQDDKATVKGLQELSDNVKNLSVKLTELLTKKADVCADCGNRPTGMKKGKGEYEIGCIGCMVRSRGETADEAAENWNNKEYV